MFGIISDFDEKKPLSFFGGGWGGVKKKNHDLLGAFCKNNKFSGSGLFSTFWDQNHTLFGKQIEKKLDIRGAF